MNEKRHYQFIKTSEFVGNDFKYYQEKLNSNFNIQTIGQIHYTSENIYLEPTDTKNKVIVHFLPHKIPADRTYVYLFGSLQCFETLNQMMPCNFDKYYEKFDVVLDVHFWKDLEHETLAERFENALYRVNDLCKI